MMKQPRRIADLGATGYGRNSHVWILSSSTLTLTDVLKTENMALAFGQVHL